MGSRSGGDHCCSLEAFIAENPGNSSPWSTCLLRNGPWGNDGTFLWTSLACGPYVLPPTVQTILRVACLGRPAVRNSRFLHIFTAMYSRKGVFYNLLKLPLLNKASSAQLQTVRGVISPCPHQTHNFSDFLKSTFLFLPAHPTCQQAMQRSQFSL